MYFTYQHNLVQACFWPPKFNFDYVYLSNVVDFYVVENMGKLYKGYIFLKKIIDSQPIVVRNA
jgi:hypothetical protein